MRHTTYWRLTIHFWPQAVEAGVTPVHSHGFEEGPQYYHTRNVDFENAPSRQDFLDVVAQIPWMQRTWGRLSAIISVNPWPMLDYGHKSASVDLLDEHGREIGRLEVFKEERWQNPRYHAPFITLELCRKVARQRLNAADYLDKNKYAIMERVSQVPNWTEETVIAEMRKMLIQAGFLKKAKQYQGKTHESHR
jgi:hypothetical protein